MNTATSQVNEKRRIETCNSGCNTVDCAASSAQKSAQIDQRIIVSLLNSAFVDKDRAVCLVSADGYYCHVLNLFAKQSRGVHGFAVQH